MVVFSTTEPRSDTRSSLRWAAVASLRSYRAIYLIFCLQTFKTAFLWCVGVQRSLFCYLRKVVSKNRSVQSCALIFANCIQRSFSEQAYQTNHKQQKYVVENELFCAPSVKCFQPPNKHCK